MYWVCAYLRGRMYRIIRSLLFLFPAETAHYLSMNLLRAACSVGFLRKFIQKTFRPKEMRRSVFGISFRNPVGLGAGFDKNAKYLRELDVLGFGFIEVGTVTPKPQEGNEKPRLFRIPKDKALINRMGFNNDGIDKIVQRLKEWREIPSRSVDNSGSGTGMMIGGNIGKNKTTPNEDAYKDYEICFMALHPYVDFFVVNVSSPNTPGLRALQEKDALRHILVHLQKQNATFTNRKPILLKIAPDLSSSQIEDVIDLAIEIKLEGIVATNTTIAREGLQTSPEEITQIGAGGLSGRPLQQRSTDVVRSVSKRAGGKFSVIGSGGIFSGEDARAKFAAGAGLIEVWTGFIYEGPFIVKKICNEIV
jgi:dihydroorotate dehydrogenase